MAFTAKDVQALREKTGVGMMDCKKALVEADGDIDKAIDILREKGLASAAKKASRVAAEGVVAAYNDANAGALVEINCETDFVAKGEPFVNLAAKVVKTVVAAKPADVEALLATKAVDSDKTVDEEVQEVFLALRENMKVRRFALVEGHTATYIHAGGTVGVLVAFDVDDATAANDEFMAMSKNVAMQIAAMSPEYLSKADISDDELAKMKSITIDSALNKPESLPVPILNSIIEEATTTKKWSDENTDNPRALTVAEDLELTAIFDYAVVDLGLSVKWATCNVGATKPEEYGNYYAWGETTTKATYTGDTYTLTTDGGSTFTKYNTTDGKTTLDPEDDAARANWGGQWRMPTDEEWTELRENCTWTWTTKNGVNGYEVKSKTNENAIFLPAAGYRYNDDLHYAGDDGNYWSSSLYAGSPYNAWYVGFFSDSVDRSYEGRCYGLSVRPVL